MDNSNTIGTGYLSDYYYNSSTPNTDIDMQPEAWKVFKYRWLARILGFTFAVKLMERGEENAQEEYQLLASEVEESILIRQQEEEHEKALLEILEEERLQYVGSMVLGLNDALVELTGSLAGFTFAMQNTRLIALSGLIMGISATFSMASSESSLPSAIPKKNVITSSVMR